MNAQLEFYKGIGFVAEIVRTDRRKTASVRVQEGKVSVVIPLDLPDSNVKQLVNLYNIMLTIANDKLSEALKHNLYNLNQKGHQPSPSS